MLTVEHKPEFIKKIKKIKDKSFKDKVIKQIKKILDDPNIGKPMRYSRIGTREVYANPYRIAYAYIEKEQKIIFLEIYHKDQQ